MGASFWSKLPLGWATFICISSHSYGFVSAFQPFSSQWLSTQASACSYARGRRVSPDPLGDSYQVVVASAATGAPEPSPSSHPAPAFENFDYAAHWYPVAWARDVPYDRPTKVTLFDTDYVITRRPYEGENATRIGGSGADDQEEVYAILDRCPHKSASLSEGRVIPRQSSSSEDPSTWCEGGVAFQCAYHGWSFDGSSGECIEIPQVVSSRKRSKRNPAEGQDNDSTGSQENRYGSRANGAAVPAMIQQGLIFLFPGGNLEKALTCPPPPRVPELDLDGYRMVPSVRDFPIDWAILLENIMDPDHGLFAHQAKPFDLYTASKDRPQDVSEETTHDGTGWTLQASVDAVDKLLKFDREIRGETAATDKNEKDSEKDPPLRATSTFYAPSHVVLARKRPDGSVVSQTIFWVSPTGTGRSRFLATFAAKARVTPPRWLGHIILNNFLDQDTHLLATAQKYILEAEADALDADVSDPKIQVTGRARRNLFVYRSPTEKLQQRLCAFFDHTLPTAPGRAASLRSLSGISRAATPKREASLDRYEQHTKICPDSLECVEKCERIVTASRIFSVLVVVAKSFATVHRSSQSAWTAHLNDVLHPIKMGVALGFASIISFLANKVRQSFYFNYPEAKRDRDLSKIHTVWANPS